MNISNRFTQFRRLISRLSISTVLLCFITACGGAGGDNVLDIPDDTDAEKLSPLVGLWDLSDALGNNKPDSVYLYIEAPVGVESKATMYFEEDPVTGTGENCFNVDGTGVLSLSEADDRLFLDIPINEYDSSVADLTPDGDLEISAFADGATSETPAEVFIGVAASGITVESLELCV